jgi:hypothetical protein
MIIAVWSRRTMRVPAAASGVYTPSLIKDSNISTLTLNQDFNYLHIGNHVIVNGSITVRATAVGYFTAVITLPVPSNFSASYDCNENANITDGGVFNCASVIADTTKKRAQLHDYLPDSTNTYFVRIVYGYLIK